MKLRNKIFILFLVIYTTVYGLISIFVIKYVSKYNDEQLNQYIDLIHKNLKMALDSFLREKVEGLSYVAEYYSISGGNNKKYLDAFFNFQTKNKKVEFASFIRCDGKMTSNYSLNFGIDEIMDEKLKIITSLCPKNYGEYGFMIHTKDTDQSYSSAYYIFPLEYNGVKYKSVALLRFARQEIRHFLLHFRKNINSKFPYLHKYKWLAYLSLEDRTTKIYDWHSLPDDFGRIIYSGQFVNKLERYENSQIFYGTIFDKSVFKEEVSSIMKNLFLILFVMLLLSYLFIYFIVKKFVSPIELLTSRLDSVDSEILDFKLPHSRVDEVGRLLSSFNRLASKLKEHQEKLKEVSSLAAIGHTAAMLAHDVRKPFSAVKSFLTMLPSKRYDDSYLDKTAREIDVATRNVENMISDILEFARKKEPELEACNVQTMIYTSLVETVRALDPSEITFDYFFEKPLYKAMADPSKITRVFNNIISNAIEAMHYKGRIWFTVSALTEKGRDFLQISVGNDGNIIPHDRMDHIFESFFTSGKKKGTGLGLAIAKKVVEEHEGQIFVKRSESVDGNNFTEFVFTVPSSTELYEIKDDEFLKNTAEIYNFIASEKKESINISRNISLVKEQCARLNRKLRVAIVDDEAIFRSSLRNMIMLDEELKNLVDIFEESNAERALELFRQTQIDYAILDIDMGKGMNGLELGTIVKKQYPNLAFIIHSNRTASEYREKAKSLGAIGFVPKPMSLEGFVGFLCSSVHFYEEQKPELCVAIVDDMSLSLDYLKMTVTELLTREKTTIKGIYTYSNPDDLLSAYKTINPDIIISDYDFGPQAEINGIDLAKIIRGQGRRVLFFISSNKPEKLLRDEIASTVKIDGVFRPNITGDELGRIVLPAVASYSSISKSAYSGFMKKFAGKLFHDINKPAMQAGLILDMAIKLLEKGSDDASEQAKIMLKDAGSQISLLVSRYSKVLEASMSELSEEDRSFFSDTYIRYKAQYAVLASIADKELNHLQASIKTLAPLLEKLKVLDRENSQYSQKISKLLD